MTYRDIPVIRSYGFMASDSGSTWARKDKEGNEWYAVEDDASVLLLFNGKAMKRSKFEELFSRS